MLQAKVWECVCVHLNVPGPEPVTKAYALRNQVSMNQKLLPAWLQPSKQMLWLGRLFKAHVTLQVGIDRTGYI